VSVALVLSIVTFNLVVSQDLPKINYSTLLDWYVWKCFLFVVFAVAEFAVVNNILTSKVLPPRVGYLIDDFCGKTLTVLWLLSNLLFWPILNVGLALFVGAIEIGFFAANVYRVWWNWQHETIGFMVPFKAFLVWSHAKIQQARGLGTSPVLEGHAAVEPRSL
jgi:hypothetical protein